jgi:hypothetical protein
MKERNYFHIYQILEEYSKTYISFEDSPEYELNKDYAITNIEVGLILATNYSLINAMVAKRDYLVDKILKEELPPFEPYTFAQLSENDAKLLNKDPDEMKHGLPLPIQARYVLLSWNAMRTGNLKKIEELRSYLQQSAFDGSFYTQTTLMAMSFDEPNFKEIVLKTHATLTRNDTYSLFYSLLTYYYRVNGNMELKKDCIYMAQSYREDSAVNKELESKILSNI